MPKRGPIVAVVQMSARSSSSTIAEVCGLLSQRVLKPAPLRRSLPTTRLPTPQGRALPCPSANHLLPRCKNVRMFGRVFMAIQRSCSLSLGPRRRYRRSITASSFLSVREAASWCSASSPTPHLRDDGVRPREATRERARHVAAELPAARETATASEEISKEALGESGLRWKSRATGSSSTSSSL